MKLHHNLALSRHNKLVFSCSDLKPRTLSILEKWSCAIVENVRQKEKKKKLGRGTRMYYVPMTLASCCIRR